MHTNIGSRLGTTILSMALMGLVGVLNSRTKRLDTIQKACDFIIKIACLAFQLGSLLCFYLMVIVFVTVLIIIIA